MAKLLNADEASVEGEETSVDVEIASVNVKEASVNVQKASGNAEYDAVDANKADTVTGRQLMLPTV